MHDSTVLPPVGVNQNIEDVSVITELLGIEKAESSHAHSLRTKSISRKAQCHFIIAYFYHIKTLTHVHQKDLNLITLWVYHITSHRGHRCRP